MIRKFHSSVVHSSDLKRENSKYLRALREGKTKVKGVDKVDYRYRKDLKHQKPKQEYWGISSLLEEEKRQKQKASKGKTSSFLKPEKTCVSFFDEVDTKMNKMKKRNSIFDNKESNSSSNLEHLFDMFNKKGDASSEELALTRNTPVYTSIFEAFPIEKRVHNPNAYEKDSFEPFEKFIRDIVYSDRFQRKNTRKPLQEEQLNPVIEWLLKDEKLIPYDYSIMQEAARTGIGSSRSNIEYGTSKNIAFENQLKNQKELFLKKTKFTEEQYKLALRSFSILASNCAKHCAEEPLFIAWEKMKEAGMIPRSDVIDVFLYVTGTMMPAGFLTSSHRSRSSRRELSSVMSILGSVGTEDAEEEIEHSIDLATELALFHDLLYEPTEKSISLRVKRLVSMGDAEAAEILLDSFPTSSDAKLRTYLPVLKLYCEQANVASALRLFKRMRNEDSVRLESENYVLLLSTIAENGYFKPSSPGIEGVNDMGYSNASGPGLFDELVTEMAEDVMEISSSGARRIYNAIAMCFEGEPEFDNIELISTLSGVKENNEEAHENEPILSRVTVEKTTGICPRSGVKLQLIKLEKDQQHQLHQSLLELSTQKFEDYNAGHSKNDDFAADQLNQFALWLDSREGDPFTAIVDGANVAYYMQNFNQGSFNYHQIQFMVDALKKMNENPLVILPFKYCSKSFWISSTTSTSARKQVLTNEEIAILEGLTKEGRLYRVPPRCLDDYYWMLASVSEQTKSRQGANLDVPADNKEGRWPGARPMLVTNDQMRDHKLGFLEPRLFRRWTSCYIVNYNFTAFVGSECADREIGFSTADFFSREIQKHDSAGGPVWHFPVSDWPLDDRFCVRIPTISETL